MSSRRTFLSTTLKAAGGFTLAPAFVRQDAARPGIPYGTTSGDVTRDRAVIWSRTDRPSRMLVEWSTTESFQNVRRFNREIPQLWLWDDHEVKNNWYPGMSLDADDRYKQKDSRVLAANARQAFLEYSPIRLSPGGVPPIYRSCSYGPLLEVFAIDLRTYRGPNTPNRQSAPGADTVHAGAEQLAWLKRALRSSTAAWKVIASDLPVGLVVRDGATAFEAIANGDAGPPLGRELEIADLLRFMRQERIRNVIWVTGDVHYAAAHHYDPQRAHFKEFDPFWEFVAGPLHAGTFGPSDLDGTFGPEVRFASAKPGAPGNRPPSDGFQFFGLTRISARTRVMTVELRNLAGETIYTIDLEPGP